MAFWQFRNPGPWYLILQRLNAQHVAKCSVSICKVTFEQRDSFSMCLCVFVLIPSLKRLSTKWCGGIKFYKKCIILALFLWEASEAGSFVRAALVQERGRIELRLENAFSWQVLKNGWSKLKISSVTLQEKLRIQTTRRKEANWGGSAPVTSDCLWFNDCGFHLCLLTETIVQSRHL